MINKELIGFICLFIGLFIVIIGGLLLFLLPQQSVNPQEKVKHKSILDILNILELHNKKLKELEGRIHDLNEGIK